MQVSGQPDRIRDEEFTRLLARGAGIVYAGHCLAASPQWTQLSRAGVNATHLDGTPVVRGLFVPTSHHEHPSAIAKRLRSVQAGRSRGRQVVEMV